MVSREEFTHDPVANEDKIFGHCLCCQLRKGIKYDKCHVKAYEDPTTVSAVLGRESKLVALLNLTISFLILAFSSDTWFGVYGSTA